MAQRIRIRRKVRRSRPQLRRNPSPAGTAARAEAKQPMAPAGGLMIGGVHDPAEKAADDTAERVMRMDAPVHRKEAAQEDEDKTARRAPAEGDKDDQEVKPKVSAKAGPVAPGASSAPASPAAASAINALGSGRPLASAERAFFEPRFAADLSPVRIHDDNEADHASKSIGARAFAHGSDIAFADSEYAPGTDDGRRLMAHELAHVVEPSPAVRRDDDDDPPPPAPTTVTFNFDAAIPQGQTGPTRLQASTDGQQITWSIEPGSTTPDSGTTIDNRGRITVSTTQTVGTLNVRATNASGAMEREMFVSAIPTGVSTTSVSSDLTDAATRYGSAFQNSFTSSDGTPASLENIRLSERFPGAPAPTAANHIFSGRRWPFGARDTFTLETKTLDANAHRAWTIDSSGQFGPVPPGSTLQQGDNVSTHKDLINVGNHIATAVNTRPVGRLPVTLTLDQDLYWFNPLAARARRWTKFTTLAHSRTLRSDGTNVEFVTTLNGTEHVQDYEGKTAVFNLNASPASISHSTPAPPGGGTAPPAKTIALSVQALPAALASGETLAWTILGNTAGCTIAADPSDSKLATLTVGTTAARITVEVADQSGTNRERIQIRIT